MRLTCDKNLSLRLRLSILLHLHKNNWFIHTWNKYETYILEIKELHTFCVWNIYETKLEGINEKIKDKSHTFSKNRSLFKRSFYPYVFSQSKTFTSQKMTAFTSLKPTRPHTSSWSLVYTLIYLPTISEEENEYVVVDDVSTNGKNAQTCETIQIKTFEVEIKVHSHFLSFSLSL